MARWPNANPNWREAEREYDDEVIGESTLPVLFEESAARHAGRHAQWYKGGIYDRSLAPEVVPEAPAGGYAALTYGEMRHVVRRLAAGFRELGVGAGDRVGVYADTRMEWAQADFALLAAGAVVTTVYTESSPERVRYLLSDPGASGVVVENGELLETLLEVEADLDLAFVVVVDRVEGYDGREDVHTLADVYRRGADAFDEAAFERWLDGRGPGDLASVIYTSGTTGRPKGVKLTHRNFRANVNQVRKRFGPRPDKPPDMPVIDAEARTLSFLPLAHVYERTAGHFVPLASGATVAYAESTDTVSEDLQLVSPTFATSVPQVYERIYEQMREQASGSDLRERIFGWALGVGREYARADDPGPSLRAKRAVADRLVFSQVREELGGNVEAFMSGGGSISRELTELFDGMDVPVNEGYGLTETAPVVSANPPEDARHGTLGPPLPGVEVRLDRSRAAEEQREAAAGEIGELLVQGPNVFEGYWNDPGATEDAFTGDGWFRTGDIVEQTDDGYLIYHDRVKQLLVLDTGKNVAPQPIEDAFETSEPVEQVMVLGDDRKFVSALIVPNFAALYREADRRGVDLPADPGAVCRDERVRQWIAEEVERVNATRPKHERIREFRIVPEEWTPENGLLTPSMKKRRRDIRERFDAEIADIYGEREPAEADD